MEQNGTILHKLRIPFFGILIFASLLFLSLLLSAIGNSVQARDVTPQSSDNAITTYDSPNVVTSALANASVWAQNSVASSVENANSNLQSLGDTATQSRKFVATKTYIGVTTSSRFIGRGVAMVAKVNLIALKFMVRVPGKVVGLVTHTKVLNSFIRPSEHATVPIIDPNSPELLAALTALPPTKNTSPTATLSSSDGPVWPIHGQITTEFGVVHWPYQPTHTGLDISDGKRWGTSVIKPFRPGKVINVVHSNVSLGNHIVIDHGNGVTSVYGHLASTAVVVNQMVDLSTVLGYEGSTGASTGNHLHFEIRVNGQAANPHQFINGQP